MTNKFKLYGNFKIITGIHQPLVQSNNDKEYTHAITTKRKKKWEGH